MLRLYTYCQPEKERYTKLIKYEIEISFTLSNLILIYKFGVVGIGHKWKKAKNFFYENNVIEIDYVKNEQANECARIHEKKCVMC